VLAIGVSDKTRRIEGVDGNEEKLNELLRVPFDFCNPSVKVKCEYMPCTDFEGRENRILLMHIPASVQLHTNQADECFMRVGDKSKKLNFDERMQLLYDKGERYYEDKDVYGATINDIDMNLVNDYVNVIGYGKSAMEYLKENNYDPETTFDFEDKEELFDEKLDIIMTDFDDERGLSPEGWNELCESVQDAWEVAGDFGKKRTGIVELYLLAFSLAKAQIEGKMKREDKE
jgi:hypothetical protein